MGTTGRSHQKQPIKYEFGGPSGAFCNLFLLPLLVWLSAYICPDLPQVDWPSMERVERLRDVNEWTKALSASVSGEAMAVVIAWFVFQIGLYYIVPGYYVQGVELPTKERLSYKINGKCGTGTTCVYHA